MAIVLAPLVAALGFQTPSGAETLTETVETALATHPLVSGSRAGFLAARERIKRERSGLLPQLSSTADSGYQRARRIDSPKNKKHSWRNSQRVAVTQLLFDGFETINRTDSAKATAESARFILLADATEIAQRAINAYLSVGRDRERVQSSLENIIYHQQMLDDVIEAAQQGGGSTSRVAQVRTRLLNARSQRRELEAALRNSIEDYIEAVGQSPGDIERPELLIGEIPLTIDDAMPVARQNSYDLLATNEREKAAGLSAEATLGAFFPTVDLELAHERRDNRDGNRGHETDYTALVRMSWDIFAGGRDAATRRQALKEESQARFQVREVDRLLRESLAIALNDYEAARDRVALQQDRLLTAIQVREAYQEQFRLAQRTLLDLLNSRQEQFEAEIDLIAVRYELLATSYDIFAISGRLLEILGVDVPSGTEDTAG